MWGHLESTSAKLEEVFEPLHKKAMEYNRPWSIAELALSGDDIKWLRTWFDALKPSSTENWIKSVMLTKLSGQGCATYRQMFGSLLICLGAEICREESREDSVWPTIRNILPWSHELRGELFLSNGQPSTLTKDLITDAVRALNLRHAMDIEGTQQWFITIKLQYGFTLRGAKNRLAEWLVYLGRPHAIQYLEGCPLCPELASKSFLALWQGLTQFRRGLITESQMCETLQNSPWVHKHWIDELLIEARSRIDTLGYGEPPEGDGAFEINEDDKETLCPISTIALEWKQGDSPRMILSLDKEIIEEETCSLNMSELDFFIDGNKIGRWIRQKDGSWSGKESMYAEPDAQKKTPNLNPQVLSIRPRTGDTLIEWDFSDSGLAEQILICNLDNHTLVDGRMVNLDANTHYAILCDCECKIEGCTPVEEFQRKGVSRKAIRLPIPLSDNICISYNDFILWQPVRPAQTETQRTSNTLTLSTPVNEVFTLNSRTRLILHGIPDDVESVQLLIHRTTHEVQRNGGVWETLKEVTITPELASRKRMVRVRFCETGKWKTREPKLCFNLLSAAILRKKQEQNIEFLKVEALEPGYELNRSEDTAFLKLWTPESEDMASIYEENCLLGKARYGRFRLLDIPGHGGNLNVRSGSSIYSLNICCVDRGCLSDFKPPMLNSPAILTFSDPKSPKEAGQDGYILWQWVLDINGKSKLERLPEDAILPGSTERKWKVSLGANPMSIALTWKNYWLGAYWDISQVREYMGKRKTLSETDLAILKWFRVPILHPEIAGILAKSIECDPCPFLKVWTNESVVPSSLKPHNHIGGLDFIVRRFLWNRFPAVQAPEAIRILTNWDGNFSHPEKYIGHLEKLINVSPVLMWKGLERFLKKDPKNTLELLRTFTCTRLGLPSQCKKAYLRSRLDFMEGHTAQVCGIDKERLEDLIDDRLQAMKEMQWQPQESDYAELARIGETHIGRQYYSTRMCCFWLNLSGMEDI